MWFSKNTLFNIMYMKRIFIYATALLTFCATMSSCEDAFGNFLEKQPSQDLTEEEVFSDWSMLEQFHFDTYNFLLHGAHRINSSWLDAATDLAECSIGTSGTRTTFNIGNYYGSGGAEELTSIWESRYRAIRKCNMVLERIDNVPKPKDDANYETHKAQYKAEARFFRAYFYWELFLRYGPLPIVTTVLDPDGDLTGDYTTRPTIKEYVVDFILNELKECESGLMSYAETSNSTYAGRINQPAARALYSRIMLYMASPRFTSASGITWQQAMDAAKGFIDDYGTNYELMKEDKGSVSAYNNAWALTTYNDNNKEVIFFRNDDTIGWSGISTDTPVGEGGTGGLCPSQNLVDMYDMADGSAPFAKYDATGAPVYDSNGTPKVNDKSGYSDAKMWENRDPRLASTILYHGVTWNNATIDVRYGMRDNPIGNQNATPTGYYVRKYIPETILANEHAGTARRLWTIIRYAEILLNYCEAINEVEGPNGAHSAELIKYLDEIRQRGGITGSVASRIADQTDLGDKDAMRNFIHKERTIELAFEEHRPWDVRRWGIATEALSRSIYGVNVASDGTISRKTAQKRVFSDKMYLYPIPEAEYWKTGIENNEGW